MEAHVYKYSYKFPRRTITSLSVCNTGIQKCLSGYSWGPGVRDHYLLHYVIAGKGNYQVFGRSYSLGAGQLFVAYPDTNIFYQSDGQDPWEYCWVGFNGTDAALLLDQTDLSRENPVCAFQDDEVYKQMMQIYHAQGNMAYQTTYMTGALYQLFSIMIRLRKHVAKRSATTGYVADACDFIANHYALPISISDVAAHVGVSRSRLYRAFQQEMQVSPVQYLTHFRIRQACTLLERQDMSVKMVALSVGYDNQLYFSRRFREIMDLSPTQFIQRVRQVPSL